MILLIGRKETNGKKKPKTEVEGVGGGRESDAYQSDEAGGSYGIRRQGLCFWDLRHGRGDRGKKLQRVSDLVQIAIKGLNEPLNATEGTAPFRRSWSRFRRECATRRE